MALTPEDIQALKEALLPEFEKLVDTKTHAAITKRNESFEKKFDELSKTVTKPIVEEEKSEKLTVKGAYETVESLRAELKAKDQAIAVKDLNNAIKDYASKKKITPAVARAMITDLHAQKLVIVDSDGNFGFKVNGTNDEYQPLEQGLEEYFKGEGAEFIPTPSVRSGGFVNLNRISTQPKVTDTEALQSDVLELMATRRNG